jgi:hypothetical protein
MYEQEASRQEEMPRSTAGTPTSHLLSQILSQLALQDKIPHSEQNAQQIAKDQDIELVTAQIFLAFAQVEKFLDETRWAEKLRSYGYEGRLE